MRAYFLSLDSKMYQGAKSGIGLHEHFVDGRLVEIPFLTVSPVLVRDLPLFFRRILTLREALKLGLLVDLNPEFDHDGAPVRQFFLEFVDLIVSSLPVVFTAEALQALHHDASVPGAVKDGDMSVLGQPCPESPQEMPGLFMRLRAGDRLDDITSWIQCRCDTLDVAALAGGIPALVGDDDRDLLAIEFVVQVAQLLLKPVQLLVIFFFGQRLVVRGEFGQLGIGFSGKIFCRIGAARAWFFSAVSIP